MSYKIEKEIFHHLFGSSFVMWFIKDLNYGGFESKSSAVEFLKTYRRKDNERNKENSS